MAQWPVLNIDIPYAETPPTWYLLNISDYRIKSNKSIIIAFNYIFSGDNMNILQVSLEQLNHNCPGTAQKQCPQKILPPFSTPHSLPFFHAVQQKSELRHLKISGQWTSMSSSHPYAQQNDCQITGCQ
uniref:Uncharacterized protein n=1 Tax=Arundo donax TaxID=35708 RepID=A0A0A9EAQ0_ARUDO